MKVLYLLLGSLVALPVNNQSANGAIVDASSTTEPVNDPVPGPNLDDEPQEILETTEDDQQEDQPNGEEDELDDQNGEENDTDQDPVEQHPEEPTNLATLNSLPTNTAVTSTRTTLLDPSQVPSTTNAPPLETLPPQNTNIPSQPVTIQTSQSLLTFTTPLTISTVQLTNQVPLPTHTTTRMHQIPEFTTQNPLPRPSVQPTPDSNPQSGHEQQETESLQFQPLIANNPPENIENPPTPQTEPSTTPDTVITESIENPPTVGPNIAQDEFSSAPSFGQVYKGNSNTGANNKKADKSSAQQLVLGIMVLGSVLLV